MKQNRIIADRFRGEFNDFGSYLKYLRRRAGLSQRELGLAVGYGEAQISRLEHNHRLPDLSMIQAQFIPALGLEDLPEMAARLLQLAHQSHSKQAEEEVISEDVGVLEEIPVIAAKEIVRASELKTLKALFEKHNTVLVYGFPGVGKSSFAAAFTRSVYKDQAVFWHTVNRNDEKPFDVFIRQLALFLVLQGQNEAALFTQPLEFDSNAEFPLLIRSLRAVRPFICVDEAQHLKSFAALERFIENSGCQFLLISREEQGIKNGASMPLMGMNEGETHSLLQTMGLKLTSTSVQALHTVTQGNPMFLRLAGAKILENPSQADRLIDQLATQKEISAFLMEKALDGLPNEALNVLHLISIFRQPLNLLDAELVEHLGAQNLATDLNNTIQFLQQRHFLENPSEARLHPILQEHLDAALRLQPDRFRELHLLAARYLQTTDHNALEAFHHFTQSTAVDETLRHLQTHILDLDSTGQGEAAAELIAFLLNRTRHTSQLSREHETQFLSLRGQLLMSGRRAAEAEADFRQALALAIQFHLPSDIHASVILKLARFLLQRGKIPEADQLCDDAQTLPASDSAPGLLAEIQAVRCTLRLTQSRFAESAELANQALTLAQPLAHREVRLVAGVRTMAYNTLGILAHIQRDIPSALSHWHKAEEAALLAGNLRTAFRIKGNIGGLLFDQGEIDEALQSYQGIVDAVLAIGDGFNLGKILNALGAIYHLQARAAEAVEVLERAKQLKRLTGDLQGEATTDNQLAQVLLASGKAQEALSVVQRLLKQTEETGEMRWRASYLDTAGMTLLALGRFGDACETLEEAAALMGAASDPQLKTYLRNHLTLALLAEEQVTKAREIFEDKEGTLDSGMVAIESRLVDAFLAAAQGNPAEARERLSVMEKEADHRSLHLYSRMSRYVQRMLSEEMPIPACISCALGAEGIPE